MYSARILCASVAGVLALSSGGQLASADTGSVKSKKSRVTIAKLKKDRSSTDRRVAKNGAFQVVQLEDSSLGVADVGLLDGAQAYVLSPEGVDIAWESRPDIKSYQILRDGEALADVPGTSEGYRDDTVRPGGTYEYKVVGESVNPDAQDAPFWGFSAKVPKGDEKSGSELSSAAAVQSSKALAAAAATEATATIGWKTFIAESFVQVPAWGVVEPCGYDDSYYFKGDGRSWDVYSQKNRTHLQATIRWSDKSVTQGAWVGPTEVWKNGVRVATRQESNSAMIARKASNTPVNVDVNFNFSAANPFCKVLNVDASKIAGSMMIRLTPGGSYSILQGSHRQMPAHQIYITRPGVVTDVYRASAYAPICLVGYMTCPNATFTRNGKF